METTALLAVAASVLCVYLLLRWRAAQRELDEALATARRMRADAGRVGDRAAATPAFPVAAGLSPDPILIVDGARDVLFCNPAAEGLWRALPAGGASLIELTRSYELDDAVSMLMTAQHEAPRELVIGRRPFRIYAASVPSVEGPPEARRAATVVLLRDMSDLQRLGRARRDFVANLSHELRTPLTAIRLLLDTARVPPRPPGPQDDILEKIGAQVDALTQIAQEMNDLSLIESGQLPMRMVAVSLSALVDDVFGRLAPQAERARVRLTNAIPADANALADPDQLARVVTNLVHNSLKFAPGGEVTAYLPERATLPPERAVPEDYLVLAVQDTGIGIPREDLPRIFERFYKVSRARGSGGGTGLGLAIAKHIVEAHGGVIWAESIEGKGATFLLSIPAA